jgi:hypothetical protein
MKKKYDNEQKEKKNEQKDADKKHDATVAPVQPANQPVQNKPISN